MSEHFWKQNASKLTEKDHELLRYGDCLSTSELTSKHPGPTFGDLH